MRYPGPERDHVYSRVGQHKGGGGQQHNTRAHGGERGDAKLGVRVSGAGWPANRVVTHRGVVVLPAALLGCKAPAYSRNYSAFPRTQEAPRRAGKPFRTGEGAGAAT